MAAKIGISRQAVSKWERAEACPDTDNLILLARLYKVSLDELLKTDESIEMVNGEEENTETEFSKRKVSFPYPVFVTLVYLILVFGFHLWRLGWLVFLTIPLYYWVRDIIRNR